MNPLTSFFLAFVATGIVFGLVALIPSRGMSQIPDNGIVVAELFTSQSCSSCPAADKVLESVAQNDNVIALSCHVTYWDHLNWKDTLSKQFCTERQKSYAKAIKNSQRVYTPQLVVNGQFEMIGSDKNTVKKTLWSSSKKGLPEIRISRDSLGLNISLPSLSSGPYEIVYMAYHDKHTQNIKSGENRGKTVTYTNSVYEIENLGMWDGNSKQVQRNALIHDTAAGVVVLAHDKRTGKIVAAGKLVL